MSVSLEYADRCWGNWLESMKDGQGHVLVRVVHDRRLLIDVLFTEDVVQEVELGGRDDLEVPVIYEGGGIEGVKSFERLMRGKAREFEGK